MLVRDLRKFLSHTLDVDDDGNEMEVYICCGNLHSSKMATAFVDEDGDLVLVPEFWKETMEDLGSWEEFTS
jgi:hypothetical protein